MVRVGVGQDGLTTVEFRAGETWLIEHLGNHSRLDIYDEGGQTIATFNAWVYVEKVPYTVTNAEGSEVVNL